MQERFLHYIWEMGMFDQRFLMADHKFPLAIVDRGTLNSDSGPDFFNAKIRLNHTLLAGNIEIHVKSSEWYKHGHQNDPAYENTILHVVHTDDRPVFLRNGKKLPSIELQGRIPSGMYQNFMDLTQPIDAITCRQHAPGTMQNAVSEMKCKALDLRLQQKADSIFDLFSQMNSDWNETFYISLCRYMGFKVNAEPMETLARRTPLKLLLKNRHNQLAVEALLFGQAGLLGGFRESYPNALKKEYDFLKVKYGLEPMDPSAWKLHRMRPGNFPTLRIAQMAALIIREPLLFSSLMEAPNINQITTLLQCEPNEFWKTHYHFSAKSAAHSAVLGNTALEGLVINVVVPFIFSMGAISQKPELKLRAVGLLESIKAENNLYTRQWNELDIHATNAAESQALIGLRKEFCEKKRCLDCSIGLRIISK